ncbi:ThiF family adenylyltransferase [Ruania zhangjianzhongii]|uniref:ThiF family adenylyltransferase n=1 Tax=Ruania zhangjianzhongii TaxID=2603206 RepID=UPI0011C78A3E|nr:ThiF family adenylyltransferase [Ruania zhangjianzhongii]
MALPPLVEPGPPLNRVETERFARHLFLPQLGEIGQRRLRAAKVAVIGVGGLGSPALLYLAGAGVATLGLFDDDVVERSNLHRQVIHTVDDIGRPKVDSGAEHLLALSPDLTVHRHHVRLDTETATELLTGYDLVLDGTDNFATRYLVNDACAELGIPLVWASIFRTDAQISVFWSRPPAGEQPRTLRDLFPHQPPEGSVPSCAEGGVLGAMCGQVGAIMANEAIKLIAGIGDPLFGRVLVLDTLAASGREIPLRPRTTAPPGSVSAPTSPSGTAASTAADGGASPGEGPLPPPSGSPAPLPAPNGSLPPPPPADEPFERISAAELEERLQDRRYGRDDFILMDVREPAEYTQRSIPGARLVPLAQALTQSGRAGLDHQVPVVVYCATGPRAERAARDLTTAGFATTVLTGGMTAWQQL